MHMPDLMRRGFFLEEPGPSAARSLPGLDLRGFRTRRCRRLARRDYELRPLRKSAGDPQRTPDVGWTTAGDPCV